MLLHTVEPTSARLSRRLKSQVLQQLGPGLFMMTRCFVKVGVPGIQLQKRSPFLL